MERGLVSDLVKGVSRRLTSEVWGFKDDMLTLKGYFDQIEEILDDVEDRYTRDRVIDLWIKSLRSVNLKVADLLDEISTEALLQRLHKERGIKYRVSAFFSSNHNPLMFRVRIAHKVKSLRKELDAIASKRSELNLTSSGAISHVDVGIRREMTDMPLTHDSFTVGRNEEVEMIIRTICDIDIGKYEDGEIRVYGIWGMGGSGKTTLAKLVYTHELVNQYFDLKFWIYVSNDFQVKEIMKDIIECIDGRECTLTHLDLLQKSLSTKLRGKRFLIILDDVWIETDEMAKWDALRATLSCGAERSIVLITTRSQITSRMMAKVPELQHRLGMLSEADSWLLFKQLAFAPGRESGDISELEPIGREIVKKCQGLPLAVKTLGSLMWSKSSTSVWQNVLNDNIWMLEYSVIPALKLSYDNLPSYIKRCFAYCCLFPKGYDMEKDVLIQLWIVNGFIPPRGEIDMYVLGDEIINFLVLRSFFQVVKDTRYLNDRYKMHDLMHDMARYIMRDDCSVIEECEGGHVIPNETLHLSLSCPDFSSQDFKKIKSLRSMFLFGVECKFNINHLYLRVLHLSGSGLKTLPESICKLKYLRYLNLSYSSIQVLPDSIIYLQNLQVLLLNFCYELCKLPEDMSYMRSLRVIEINSCHSLLDLPVGIKEITKLPRLTRFHVGKRTPKIQELGNVNHFDGELEISGLENVESSEEAKGANLKLKTNLSVLKLCWSNIHMRESKRKAFADDEKVLNGLEPNLNLKKLSIYFFMGNTISADWMVKLENLIEIGFSGCKRCESIPPLGSLPNLKAIKLLGMDSLVCFHDKDTSDDPNMFRCLQELHIFMCPNLISLPSNLSTLRVLKLEECGALMSLPVQRFKSLKEVKISGCGYLSQRYGKHEDEETLSHIPDIIINSLRL
ncbi:putative P-loop containing nucleoside triphosphate hydrolase, leucine-rich repeat domain superfamily [Helianthus anomalus]